MKEEIAKQKYSLAPSKYIEFIDHDLKIDAGTGIKWVLSEIQKALTEERETIRLLEVAAKVEVPFVNKT
jgi:type I restriction enzyme M protein